MNTSDFVYKINKVLSKYDFITFSLLFGSYAKNTQNVYLSDIDIAIYTSYEIDILTLGSIISHLEDTLEKKVDLVLLNNLYKTNPKFSFSIIENHHIIFCNQMDKYFDFKTNSIKYYLDSKYMYDMFDKSFLERLKNGNIGKTQAS